MKCKKKEKHFMKHTLTKFAVLITSLLAASAAFAQEAAHAATTAGLTDKGMAGFGAGLAIGIAALGGGLGQGKAASAALDGIARNPGAQGKIFIPMILGLVFIESLVIYSLIIALRLS